MNKILNRKAFHEFFILDDYIAGLQLVGSEVKSIRKGDCNISDAYIYIKDGEVFVRNMWIAQHKESTYQNHDENRDKKLLLSRQEINQIEKKMDKGTTIIPLEVFCLKNRLKIKIGIAKGKKSWDKRESIKKKDLEREMKRGQI